jgi:hypothetical protein
MGNKFEILEVKNGSIFLDGKEIKNMTDFEMKAKGEECGLAEITITKTVSLGTLLYDKADLEEFQRLVKEIYKQQ